MRISDWSSDVCSSDLSVRTLADCEQEAQADITVETALLESRWLAGSRALMKQFEAAIQAQLDAPAFFQARRVEMQQRHARYQDTPYALDRKSTRLNSSH